MNAIKINFKFIYTKIKFQTYRDLEVMYSRNTAVLAVMKPSASSWRDREVSVNVSWPWPKIFCPWVGREWTVNVNLNVNLNVNKNVLLNIKCKIQDHVHVQVHGPFTAHSRTKKFLSRSTHVHDHVTASLLREPL